MSGKARISERTTVYLRLAENYFEPETLMSVLRKVLGDGDSNKLVQQAVDSTK